MPTDVKVENLILVKIENQNSFMLLLMLIRNNLPVLVLQYVN